MHENKSKITAIPSTRIKEYLHSTCQCSSFDLPHLSPSLLCPGKKEGRGQSKKTKKKGGGNEYQREERKERTR